jgi:CheY-like chemotaxis protein
MLIDDDQDDIELFSDALGQIDASIHLVTAHNGREALALLGSDILDQPDHIFLDINMPIMNGIDCLETMREQLDIRIPVTMYTTSQNPREYSRCKSLGAEFLPKPDNYTVLTEILAKKVRDLMNSRGQSGSIAIELPEY